jgi:hypothetical protein
MSKKDQDREADAAPEVRDQIQENLRALYDQTVSEDLPDKFLDLLKKLEQQDKK